MEPNDDELRALDERQKRKLDALDAKYNRLSQEIANREAQNPYESPRDAPAHPPFNWQRLFYRGLWVAACGFVAIGTVAALSEPSIKSAAGMASLAVAVAAGVALNVGILMAIVGGIGWSVTMKKR